MLASAVDDGTSATALVILTTLIAEVATMQNTPPERALALLVDALRTTDPVPAGGAAAVSAIAMGIAVGEKVARISRAPARFAERFAILVHEVLPAFEEDCEAFRAVLAARREKAPAPVLAAAWQRASEVPLGVAARADEARTLLEELRPHTKAALVGDLEAALVLCDAGARISRGNASLNQRPRQP